MKADPWTVVALTWACFAVGFTVVFGPMLGLRGWAWLIVHHVVCVVGVTHELWRANKRLRAAQTVTED